DAEPQGTQGNPEPTGNPELWRGIDQAHIMGVELIVAVLLWSGIGYLIDGWLGSMPWFTVFGALLGNVAGLYLIYLRSQRIDALASAPIAPAESDQASGPGGHVRGS
ncbi:MAG: AtpZ/AtpI family protein, partial [Nitriliruptoraceae bacterium]